MDERLECHIRYCFYPNGNHEPSRTVVACGRGSGREVRILAPDDRVLWYAPFKGTMNSSRARIALGVYLKAEKARINATREPTDAP